MNELFESSYLSIMSAENDRLRKELQQKENIIKEVREYIESSKYWNGDNWNCLHCEKLLEILDKGE